MVRLQGERGEKLEVSSYLESKHIVTRLRGEGCNHDSSHGDMEKRALY